MRRKIKSADLPDIFKKVYVDCLGMTEVAKLYGVSQSTISINLRDYKIAAYADYVTIFGRSIERMMTESNAVKYKTDKDTLMLLVRVGQKYFPYEKGKPILM